MKLRIYELQEKWKHWNGGVRFVEYIDLSYVMVENQTAEVIYLKSAFIDYKPKPEESEESIKKGMKENFQKRMKAVGETKWENTSLFKSKMAALDSARVRYENALEDVQRKLKEIDAEIEKLPKGKN